LHRQYDILLLIIVLSFVNNACVKNVIKRKKGEQIRLLDKDWASGFINGIKYDDSYIVLFSLLLVSVHTNTQTLAIFLYRNPNKIHKSQSLFYLTTALHVSDVTITHLQKHKTTVTTASGKRYTVIHRVKFTDK
jgi:hypothetical protein